MPGRLHDKIAIVTGSDSGIGQAIAEAFANEGADVAVTYHTDRDGAEETARRIASAGRRFLVRKVDVQAEDQVEALFDDTDRLLGTPDILVNNAGINGALKPIGDLSTEEFDAVLRTNLYGTFFGCRRFARLRQASGGGGRIVNISSVHEVIPFPGGLAYDCAKGALRMLARHLALELAAQKTAVNNIGPGMILTPMNQEALDDPRLAREYARNIPWKRPGLPQEVAALAVYLASDEADYVTGQTIFIDGGLTVNLGQGA